MENAQQIFDALSHVVFGLVLLATVIVRITPTKADDKKLDDVLKKVHKFMALFPTVGRNPRTKELEKKGESVANK
jgi:hypothetical protein